MERKLMFFSQMYQFQNSSHLPWCCALMELEYKDKGEGRGKETHTLKQTLAHSHKPTENVILRNNSLRKRGDCRYTAYMDSLFCYEM